MCFFAHHESELRKPEDDPALLEAQLQAEALASAKSLLLDATLLPCIALTGRGELARCWSQARLVTRLPTAQCSQLFIAMQTETFEIAGTEQYQQILAAASLDMVAEASPTSSPGQLNLAVNFRCFLLGGMVHCDRLRDTDFRALLNALLRSPYCLHKPLSEPESRQAVVTSPACARANDTMMIRLFARVQLLQALLQSSGANSAVHQPPVNWTGDNDGQERVRLLQLQNLLAALQVWPPLAIHQNKHWGLI